MPLSIMSECLTTGRNSVNNYISCSPAIQPIRSLENMKSEVFKWIEFLHYLQTCKSYRQVSVVTKQSETLVEHTSTMN